MNNETMQLLYNRKSVRAYEKQPIPEADVQAILRAAVEAPTAGNMTLWSAIRVTDEAKKKRLSETCDNQPFIAAAPLVLVFCADYKRWYDLFASLELGETLRRPGEGDMMLAMVDAVIAAHASVVAADALGYGSCYIGDIIERCEQQREKIFGKIKRLVFRHIGHRPRGDNIDPGVHKIGHDVLPIRFLDEVLHEALPVLQHEPVLQRLRVRVERDRHGRVRLLMPAVESQQVKAACGVAADDEKIVLAVKVAARTHTAGRAARLGLDAVFQVHAVVAAVAAVLLNDLRPVAQRHAHVREAVAPQQIQQPVEHWHADERHHGFREVSGDAAQPPALTAGQQNCFHAHAPFTNLQQESVLSMGIKSDIIIDYHGGNRFCPTGCKEV